MTKHILFILLVALCAPSVFALSDAETDSRQVTVIEFRIVLNTADKSAQEDDDGQNNTQFFLISFPP